MARSCFVDLLHELRIPDTVQQAQLDENYDTETFGLLALSLTELDSAIDSMGLDITPRIRSSFRVLWTHGQPAAASGLAHASFIPASGDSSDLSSGSRTSSSWNEPFQAKLSPDLIRELRDNFERQYAGELLDPDLMPSSRMLALTYQQLQQKKWKWIAWKYRLCAKLQDESRMIRARKAARADLSALSDLLIDDIPVREIPQSNIGLQQLSQLLHLQAAAVAFCRGARLSTLKKYVHRFLAHASQRFDSESGLRPPNVSEIQMADQVLWGKIAGFFNYKQWTSMTPFTNSLKFERKWLPCCNLAPFVPRVSFKGQQQRQW